MNTLISREIHLDSGGVDIGDALTALVFRSLLVDQYLCRLFALVLWAIHSFVLYVLFYLPTQLAVTGNRPVQQFTHFYY